MLDIDGVIALLGPGDGETTFEAVVSGFPVTIAEAMSARLSRLSERFQLVWASSWMERGAKHLAPVVELPDDLPFIRFDPNAERRRGSYKLRAVQAFVRDRPCAWVDDELGEDVGAWAEQRDQPTLLIHPDPRIGLTDAHVEELMEFGAEIEGGRVDAPERETEPMKLWLDDAREPSDETWTWVRTVEAAMTLMRTGRVTEASLDNDLGSDDSGQRLEEGRVLCRWMADTGLWPSQEITIHSGNVTATAEMKDVIRRCGPFVQGWHAANFVKPKDGGADHDREIAR